MYTAPPSGDEETDTETAQGRTEHAETESADAPDAARESPALEETTGTTDANWTGTVPADD